MNYKEVIFEVVRDIYWDDWGKMVKVFSKGHICQGELYPDGSVVAESPFYEGISDFVDLDCIRIMDKEDKNENIE